MRKAAEKETEDNKNIADENEQRMKMELEPKKMGTNKNKTWDTIQTTKL